MARNGAPGGAREQTESPTSIERGGAKAEALPPVARQGSRDRVAVVIPTYKAADTIVDVVSRIPDFVEMIVLVDDKCPQSSGDVARRGCTDTRLVVVENPQNLGVGGATLAGYAHAFDAGATIAVKLDSDGQMDPALISGLIAPIRAGLSDYVKGNRFFNPEDVKQMPASRLIGNLGLSFLTKLSSGYWTVFDPTNGFTALHVAAYRQLPTQKISQRYFFESDMLFRLHVAGAVVSEFPMKAKYDGEHSSLSVAGSLFEFAGRHLATMFKRIAYEYFLRDFRPASLNLIVAIPLGVFAIGYGLSKWIEASTSGVPASPGAVAIPALAAVLSYQSFQSFLTQDYNAVPRMPLQKLLGYGE